MKRILLLFAAIITIFRLPAQAQQPNTKNEKSLLWSISGKHMSKPSYIFGTIHMICPDDYIWTHTMDSCFLHSDQVCFELDLDNPQVMMEIATAMMNQSGKTLKEYFTEEQYAKIKSYLKDSLDLDITMLSKMKPVAILSLLTEKTANCDNPTSYEQKLAAEAKEHNKEIVGLEKVKEQMDLLDGIPIDTVVKEIMESLQNTTDDRSEYQVMVNAYKRQDLQSLYNIIKKSKDLGDDMGAFLDKRNKKWIDRMVDKMDQKSVFFAVGAGHLWGENGVINLLRKEGYTVKAVN